MVFVIFRCLLKSIYDGHSLDRKLLVFVLIVLKFFIVLLFSDIRHFFLALLTLLMNVFVLALFEIPEE